VGRFGLVEGSRTGAFIQSFEVVDR